METFTGETSETLHCWSELTRNRQSRTSNAALSIPAFDRPLLVLTEDTRSGSGSNTLVRWYAGTRMHGCTDAQMHVNWPADPPRF
ncbi:MAG: hypothetical protein KDA96_08815 [Planctomycetaceae bacterium]|nr:hypothetical protein [Planctomycetaceae bacterium]